MEGLILIRLILLFQGIAIFLILLLEYIRSKQIEKIYDVLEDMLDLDETQTKTTIKLFSGLSKLKFRVFLLEHGIPKEEGNKKDGRTKGKHEL